MSFSTIIGQAQAITTLKLQIKNHSLAQSYLFYGPEGVGKLLSAFTFAKALHCQNTPYDSCDQCSTCMKIDKITHPDLLYVFPTPKFETTSDGQIKKDAERIQVENYIEQRIMQPYKPYAFSKNTSIQIDTIRRIERVLHFKPTEGTYRMVIIEDADKMNIQAANAFLKTLEEPPAHALIIMTTTKISALLPTILSRCQKLRFSPINQEIMEKHLKKIHESDPIRTSIATRIANGSVAKALTYIFENPGEAREMMFRVINAIQERDFYHILSLSDRFAQNQNEALLRNFFNSLSLWFGDLLYLQHAPEKIINIDKQDLLLSFSNYSQMTPSKIRQILHFIEQQKNALHHHVNFELLFIHSIFKLYTLTKP